MGTTEEAYEKVRRMIENASKPAEIPDIALTSIEERVLATAIRGKIMQHGGLPEYHADLVADHVIFMVQDFLVQKLAAAKEKQSNPMSGGSFRRSEE